MISSYGFLRRVLIVGGNGTVGGALASHLRDRGFDVTTTSRHIASCHTGVLYLDLLDYASFRNVTPGVFDTVVFCAAISSIPVCQEDPDRTRTVNVNAPLALSKLIEGRKTHFIFISSNTVFAGSRQFPSLNDTPSPLTEYGRQKTELECRALQEITPVAVVRFSKIIDPEHKLFVEWAKRLSAGEVIRPYFDKFFAPISIGFAVSVLAKVIESRSTGIVQASASCDISYSDAAFFLASRFSSRYAFVEPVRAPPEHLIAGRWTALDADTLRDLGFSAPSPYDAFCDLQALN